MAKRVLRARKPKRDDDSLLVRSAESLGRVIGSLRRQMHGTSKRAAALADDAIEALPGMPRLDTFFPDTLRPRPKRKKKATARRSGTRKVSGTSKAARARSASRTSSKKR
jgi:hypothetical protein